MTQFFRRHSRSIVGAIFGSMIVTAILFVWLPYQRESQIAQAIERTGGGRATFDFCGPDLVPFPIRDNVQVFNRITSVTLYDEDVPNQVVDSLKTLRHLESLYLAAPKYGSHPLKEFHQLTRLSDLAVVCTPLNDKDWDEVLKTTSLRAITLSQMDISDYGIVALGKMAQLRFLALERLPIDDADLKQLKGLTSLTYLSLRDTSITGEGFGNFQGMPALFALFISDCPIADQSLMHLKSLAHLKVLELRSTQVGDAGLEHLAQMNLYKLDLSGTPVTDAGLEYLSELKHPEVLVVRNTKVTDAGIQRFHEARPDCSVHHNAK